MCHTPSFSYMDKPENSGNINDNRISSEEMCPTLPLFHTRTDHKRPKIKIKFTENSGDINADCITSEEMCPTLPPHTNLSTYSHDFLPTKIPYRKIVVLLCIPLILLFRGEMSNWRQHWKDRDPCDDNRRRQGRHSWDNSEPHRPLHYYTDSSTNRPH